MASLSLTGPASNPDVNHTLDSKTSVHSQGTIIDGITAELTNITDVTKPMALPKAVSVTYISGSSLGTVTVLANKMDDNSLYRLTVSKPVVVVRDGVKETVIISASIHLDTRPMNA